MEVSGRGRRSSSREMTTGTTRSPERARVGGASVLKPTRPVVVIKPTFRKVQVVYYLCRNGLLEHPHYMEVTHLAHQPLRLKDLTDRLTVLRGKSMPSLYSWSCKRSYKNGYVWNDLGENDVIYPSEGAEYVLKGSELIHPCTEKFQQRLQVSTLSQAVPDPTFHQKRKPLATKRQCDQPEADVNSRSEEEEEEEEQEGDDDDDNQDGDETREYEDKKTCSMTMTPPQHASRCSRGVSELTHKNKNNIINTSTELLTLDDSSPPSTTSSTISDKAHDNNNASMRFEDGDPISFESSLSRNSVLLQFISCGGSASFRAMKTVPVVSQQRPPPPSCTAARKSTGSNLHKGVLCKTAAKAEEEAEMISCMSENPRFGNLQAEEKEYFSGSIVEERVQVEPVGLKRSNSYNEERCSSKAEVVETVECEPKREKVGAVKAKCIPRMKSSSSSSKQTKK
ncbi:hypothetical protein RHSIM_Rhsim08G0009300 [Rhododendron simsii]|uniref:SOSEKI DIX-like domain-containing protein n=1 Tax=Rhododendron simsii TaxID=118357 RepID=A0A834LIG6_RHOSS|nr:hypothetical protein RHSIM_Rhsim08G0009300 [Rhododendron simsii]